MRNTLIFAAALLASLSLNAKADPLPGTAEETLDFTSAGDAKMNGADFKEGQSKSVDVYADVVKVIQGPDNETVLYLRPVEAHMTNTDGSVQKTNVTAEARPFVAENSWKMYDAEGEVTDDPRFALRVIMPYPVLSTDSIFMDTVWNECQGPVTGNYTGLPCNKNRGLSDDYMAYLKQNFLPTVNKALAATGLPAAASVHITHDGTVADERHSRGSLHAVGRAVDIQIMTPTDAAGKEIASFDFRKTNTDHRLSSSCKPAGTQLCKFYEAFRAEWGKLQVARRCPGRQSGPIGTIGWEDSRHIAHHLHTSYPFCPNNKGYFITKSKD
jgi:hypothetical protein